MVSRLLQGGALLALTVMVHAVLFTGIVEYLRKRHRERVSLSLIAYGWLLARIAVVTVLAHLLEIGLWAAFYVFVKAVPTLETGFYFSSVTYATIGYGDVVPAPTWRLLPAMEGLTGILMCSWSGDPLLRGGQQARRGNTVGRAKLGLRVAERWRPPTWTFRRAEPKFPLGPRQDRVRPGDQGCNEIQGGKHASFKCMASFARRAGLPDWFAVHVGGMSAASTA